LWLLHHQRKGRTAEGQAARSTGALQAEVEIVLEMHRPRARGTAMTRICIGWLPSNCRARPKGAKTQRGQAARFFRTGGCK
jgi:hypothetical protein